MMLYDEQSNVAVPPPLHQSTDVLGLEARKTRYELKLRDRFAGIALRGFMTGKFKTPKPEGLNDIYDIYAGWAYELADAMMAERENV